jgi:hypothetical protein
LDDDEKEVTMAVAAVKAARPWRAVPVAGIGCIAIKMNEG